MNSKVIVITGAGVVTCLGLDIVSTWRRLCECRDGLGPLTAMEQPSLPGKDGGQAPPLPGDSEPVVFETERDLAVVRADAIATVNKSPDAYPEFDDALASAFGSRDTSYARGVWSPYKNNPVWFLKSRSPQTQAEAIFAAAMRKMASNSTPGSR